MASVEISVPANLGLSEEQQKRLAERVEAALIEVITDTQAQRVALAAKSQAVTETVQVQVQPKAVA
jgi:hypothetical protein